MATAFARMVSQRRDLELRLMREMNGSDGTFDLECVCKDVGLFSNHTGFQPMALMLCNSKSSILTPQVFGKCAGVDSVSYRPN